MVSMREITKFSRLIAREYHPERIVLFGSYARGTQTRDSDVDLLIVMPFEGKAVEKSVEMRLRFHPRFPLDILVRTPEKVWERLEMGDSFMQDILTSGKVLYEADNL